MHCNLRPPDATPIVIRFNYDAHAKVGFDCKLIFKIHSSTGSHSAPVCRIGRQSGNVRLRN